MTAKARHLKSLGKRRNTPFTYSPELLEAVPMAELPGPAPVPWVSLLCLRFTSLCPVTNQPDWAELDLNYLPDGLLIESKSLKEYLNSFRMHGGFHEDVCRTVVKDLAACIRPRYLEIAGRFDSRGSIAIWPYVQYAMPGDAEAKSLLAHRRREYAPGRWSPSSLPR